MNILMDIAHPAHVHFLRNTYFSLVEKGHTVFVTVKDIPVAKQLLDIYKIPFINLGEKKDSVLQKGIEQLKYNYKIFQLVRRNNIEIGVGSSITLAHVSKLTKMKSIIMDDDDDEVEPLFVKYGHPYLDVLLSPQCTIRKSNKVIKYQGYHELAYLHPKIFEPNLSILEECGLKKEEKYFILRFNAFKAHHDVGVEGLSIESKRKLIDILSKHGKVFITTERNIDDEFKQYQLKVSPEKAHSLIAYATLLVGDSQTMTSEAAVLGVPSIRCNSFVGRISYLEEEEHTYGLTYGFLPKDTNRMFDKLNEILSLDNIREIFQKRRSKLLEDKINVSEFFTWFIINYPESKQIMKDNPNYQYKFK